MPATQAPPASAPAIPVKSPSKGPSLTSVNMPAAPSAPNTTTAPAAPPGTSGPTPTLPPNTNRTPAIDLSKWSRPAEEGLTSPNTAPKKSEPAPAESTEQPTEDPEKAKAAEPEEEKDQPELELEQSEEPDEYEDGVKPAETAKAEPGKQKKPQPWKLAEAYKKERDQLATELAEVKKLIPNEKEAKENSTRLTTAEQRVKELEDHLRLVDYQNHPEFKEKYEKPYVEKWQSILRRVQGVTIKDANGNSRTVQPADIQKLGSLPADQAIEAADAMFGKLGNWVAERVEELKQLEDSKFTALESAKKDASTAAEAFTAQNREIGEFLAKTWNSSVDKSAQGTRYAKFFKPTEGDNEWNSRLEAGFKKVDEALSADPRDPKLTNEQRSEIIMRTARMRNKAAAWGVLNLTIKRLEAKLQDAESRLSKYEKSTPTVDGQGASEAPAGTQQTGYTMDKFGQALQKFARPGVT